MKLRILVIGIGNPVPTFIYRRLLAMIASGVEVIIAKDYGQQLADVPDHLVGSFGHWKSMSLNDLGKYILNILIHPARFFKVLSVRSELSIPVRLKWSFKHFPLTCLRPPNVIHVQWLSMATEYSWLKSFYNCPLVASARGSQVTVYPVTKPGYRETILRALNEADYIHCVSVGIMEKCKALGSPSEKVFLNYNGVNLGSFTPSNFSEQKPSFKIIAVGGLMWRKGYLFHLLVLKELMNRGRKDAQLLIVGSGGDLAPLIYVAMALGVESHVQFRGHLSPESVVNELQGADLYLSCSVAEGLANGVAEAAACGLPVIAFDCEGMHEVIDHNETGLVVPFGDVSKAAESIIALLENPVVRRAMSVKARAKMERQFDANYWTLEAVKKIYRILAET